MALTGFPAPALASTGTDTPPPPCALGTSTVMAGTPLDLSGTRSTNEAVTAMARRDDGAFLEGTVATLNGTWRAVLLFGAGDAGSWTVDISVDNVNCASPITVILPAGVAAPATQAPEQLQRLGTYAGGTDGPSLQTVALVAGVALVGGSWILLLLVALARAIGARPLAGRSSRWIIRGAAFLGVLGGCLAAWLVVDVAVGMSHFDSGIPPDQQVLLAAGFWVALIGGSVLGTLAARRVRPGPAADIRTVR